MTKWGKFRGLASTLALALGLSLAPAAAMASGPVANILFYTGSACAENSGQRIYFCLDFRNSSGGYDVTFDGDGMRFDWSVATGGVEVDSGGSIARYGMRSGTPASWGFHRQEVNGLTAGTTYLVTMTVDNGGQVTVKTLNITTPGSAPAPSPEPETPSESESVSSASPEPEEAAPSVGSVTLRAASQMNGGETLAITIAVVDANSAPMSGKTVTLFSTGPGNLSALSATTNGAGEATVNFTAPAEASGFATIYATVDSTQQLKSIEISPRSNETRRFGGYAVIHPTTNHVCGVIVSNGATTRMSSDYMGCPAGSLVVFQTKPSPTGNVAGWHGTDVFYRGGTFYLPGGTTITDGIATDSSGRVWDTGTGQTLVQGSVSPSQPAPSTSSPSASESESVASESQAPQPEPPAAQPESPAEPEPASTVAINTSEEGVRIVVENGVGKRLSARIAGRWLVETVDASPFEAFRPLVPGSSVQISVWLDGEFVSSKTVSSGEPSTQSPVVAAQSSEPSSSPEVSESTSSTVSNAAVGIESSGNVIEFQISNAAGKRVSLKIGGRWVVEYPESNSFAYSTSSVAGAEVDISVYLDGVLIGGSSIQVGQTESVSITTVDFESDEPTTSSPASSPAQSSESPEVSVSSSDSQIVISTSNAEGRKLSLKIGGRWVVRYPDTDNYVFTTESIAGSTVAIRKYIDGSLLGVETITVGG